MFSSAKVRALHSSWVSLFEQNSISVSLTMNAFPFMRLPELLAVSPTLEAGRVTGVTQNVCSVGRASVVLEVPIRYLF